MELFHDVTLESRMRRTDRWGHGHFGSGRGNHTHQGIDFVAHHGEEVFSPIEGDIVREAAPYGDDPRYVGLVIKGSGAWLGVEVKLFYVEGERSGPVKPGERIGTAQDIAAKYRGITNHVHLEVRVGGTLLSPEEAYGQCFDRGPAAGHR